MTHPSELPTQTGPSGMSGLMAAANAWFLALKANWAGAEAPPNVIDGLIQYFTPEGSGPWMRYRRAGAWAALLDDVGRETSNLNNTTRGGLWFFGAGTTGAPFAQQGSAFVVPRPDGLTQFAFRQSSNEADIAWVRVSTSIGPTTWTSWRPVYTAANIVGAVARSGGVPTGALFESDVLSSGHYLRLPDGTQICHATRTLTFDTVGQLSNLWPLTRPFNGGDYRVSFGFRSQSAAPAAAMFGTPRIGDTSTATHLRIVQPRDSGQTNFQPGDTCQLDVTVYGRWASA